MIGYAAGDRPDHVERVEGWHARAGFRDVEARERQVQLLARGADGDLQQEALGAAAFLLADQVRIERAAALVEEQRIFTRPLRHDAFGQAGHENDAKAAAPRLVWCADKEPAVPSGRRIPVERDQTVVEDVLRLLERHRTDTGHRPQIGERLEDPGRLPQRPGRQHRKALQPLSPRGPFRPPGKIVDDWQRELAEVLEVPEIPLEPRDSWGLRLLGPELGDAVMEVCRQP